MRQAVPDIQQDHLPEKPVGHPAVGPLHDAVVVIEDINGTYPPAVVIPVLPVEEAELPPARVVPPPLAGGVAVGDAPFRNIVGVLVPGRPVDGGGHKRNVDGLPKGHPRYDKRPPLVVVKGLAGDAEVDAVTGVVTSPDRPGPGLPDGITAALACTAGLTDHLLGRHPVGAMVECEGRDEGVDDGPDDALYDRQAEVIDKVEPHPQGEPQNPPPGIAPPHLVVRRGEDLQEVVGQFVEKVGDQVVIGCSDKPQGEEEQVEGELQHPQRGPERGLPGLLGPVPLHHGPPRLREEELQAVQHLEGPGDDLPSDEGCSLQETRHVPYVYPFLEEEEEKGQHSPALTDDRPGVGIAEDPSHDVPQDISREGVEELHPEVGVEGRQQEPEPEAYKGDDSHYPEYPVQRPQPLSSDGECFAPGCLPGLRLLSPGLLGDGPLVGEVAHVDVGEGGRAVAYPRPVVLVDAQHRHNVPCVPVVDDLIVVTRT